MKLHRHRAVVELTTVSVLLVGVLLLPKRATAGPVGADVIAMFPKQVAEFAYTDIKSARQYPWFSAFREQLLPPHFHDFERFLVSAGIDPNTRLNELAWSQLAASSRRAGDEVLGIGFGSFDPASNEDRLKQLNLRVIEYEGYHFYANGAAGASDVFFAFLDSNMAAFGQREALEKLVELRMGHGESLLTNDTLFPLISEADDSSVIWAVFDKRFTPRTIQRFIPEASLFPQTGTLIVRMHALMINIDGGTSLDVRLQAVCGSSEDANLLGAFLQAGVMARRYQQQSSPDLSQDILEGMRVTPRGDRLQVESSVSDDQLGAIIKNAASEVSR